MNPRRSIAILVLVLAAGPGCDAMDEPTEVIFHINSFRTPCVGVAPMNCLQVKRGDPAQGEWQLFYSHIDGFEFEPGFRYRVRVRETQLPPDEVPADASSIRYELVEIMDKFRDPNAAIHDIWILRSIDGTRVSAFDPASRTEQPYLELNIVRGKFLGNDGCSPIGGELVIAEAPQLRLVRDNNADPALPCGDSLLQTQLGVALDRVASWRRDGLSLALLDESGNEVLFLRKTD